MKSTYGDFECAQNKPMWEIISQTGFEINAAPCCQTLEWSKDGENGVFTATNQINEEYPVYQTTSQNGQTLFMWWMWHDTVGHWVINQ